MDTDTPLRCELPTAQKMGMHATLASQRNKLKKNGIHNGKTETAILHVLGEELIAPVFHFNVESLAELAIIDNLEIARCAARVGNSICAFIALKEKSVEKHTLYPAQKYPEEWSARALEPAISYLGEFAKYAGGVNVRFCPQTPSTFHEPIRDKKDVFYFYVFTTPSGGKDDVLYPSEMFGESIEVSGGFLPHLKPTHGRGVILSDGKINIAQVVGNNVYLLWDPIVLMGEKMAIGRLVFRKALAHIFSYLLSDKSKVDEHPDAGASLTEENVRDQLDIFAKAGHSSLLEDLAKQEERIRKKEQELAHMKAEFVFIRRLNNFIIRENLLDGELQNNLLRDRKRILDHKMLTGVRVTKHGIEVDTKLIRIARTIRKSIASGHSRYVSASMGKFRFGHARHCIPRLFRIHTSLHGMVRALEMLTRLSRMRLQNFATETP